MVGAGISSPSVPLAMDIVSDCKLVAHTYGRTAEPAGRNGIDLYSHWFQTAYSEPYQRQEYLLNLIDGKPITHANFRLAHLLLDHTVSNIVVTTNFDDFLSKALTLFGKSHIVCDHPQTVGRINHNQPMVQIVHLHGSYWFYDCCNLRGELEDRAQQSVQTTLTMASLLDMILWDRSPLIIGYSGWEGDVFLDALKRRLARPLRSNAYWFCYRRTDIDSLPDWLKRHPNISFVVPRKIITAQLDIETEIDRDSVEGIEVTGFSKKEAEPVLPADTVLSRLIQAFELDAPELTSDPLRFFASQLDNSLPKDSASDSDTDIYAIKSVIERVRKAKEREAKEIARTLTTPAESEMERVRDALRRADYRAAIQHALRLDLDRLSPEHLDELADAVWSAARGLRDNSEDEMSAYPLVIRIRRQLEKQSPQSLAATTQLVRALFNHAVSLGERNKYEEEIQIYDEVIEQYGQSLETELQTLVAKSLVNKGVRLSNALNRTQEAIEIYKEIVTRFGAASEVALKEQVAKALVNTGFRLGTLNRAEEAIAFYDEVVRRFGEAQEIELRERVARALVNKAIELGVLDRSQEAIDTYNYVIRIYGDAEAAALREQVARALINKGVQLRAVNRNDEAIAAYDEVVRRFEEAAEPALTELVAKALINKGLRLIALSRTEDAIAVFDDVVRRFGAATEPELKDQVAKAEEGKKMALSQKNPSGQV